jgi:hypothetical protein
MRAKKRSVAAFLVVFLGSLSSYAAQYPSLSGTTESPPLDHSGSVNIIVVKHKHDELREKPACGGKDLQRYIDAHREYSVHS